MKFLQPPPRFVFFIGRGGVGKTSIACATAVQPAEASKRILLVNTDPASTGQRMSKTASIVQSRKKKKYVKKKHGFPYSVSIRLHVQLILHFMNTMK